MRTRLIVNPNSDQGHTLTILPQITRELQQLGIEFDVVQTQAPGHAVQLAQEAVAQGYERVVAVGGDGTCNEIANGLLKDGGAKHSVVMGLIPSGSGNDWAAPLGIPLDVTQACAVLKDGAARTVDAGRVTVDGEARIFINIVGLGLDAEVAVDIQHTHWLRGFARYLLSVLKVLMFGRWPYAAQFSYDEQRIEQSIVLLTVGNGTRAGGGFLLTPDAKMDDGLFDICYASELSRLSLLKLLPKVLEGQHTHHPAVTMARADTVDVFVPDGITGHIDGETLCLAGHQFKFEILPGALRVWL